MVMNRLFPHGSLNFEVPLLKKKKKRDLDLITFETGSDKRGRGDNRGRPSARHKELQQEEPKNDIMATENKNKRIRQRSLTVVLLTDEINAKHRVRFVRKCKGLWIYVALFPVSVCDVGHG